MSGAARLARVSVTTAGLAGGYIWYDYKTCHPMRQIKYDPEEAIVRFHNMIVNRIPMAGGGKMSLEQMGQYDGTNGKPTFFSAGGKIYDVSQSAMFSTTYSQWAGKDATVALAKMSLEKNDISRTDIWKSLSDSDQVSLQSWTDYFDEKYYIKGKLKEWHDEDQKST